MYEISSSIKDIRTESNIKSQQECALLADKTEGGRFWVYERDRQECHVKPSDERRGVKSQSVAGYRGCGQLSQEEWDGMMSSDCKRAYSTNIPGEDITFKKVESQQSCAELSVETLGGLFWTFNQSTGKCQVKGSDEGKAISPHMLAGNRECGLMPNVWWNEIMFADCVWSQNQTYLGENITSEIVESQESCARLTVSTNGGLYWSYDQATHNCMVCLRYPHQRRKRVGLRETGNVD